MDQDREIGRVRTKDAEELRAKAPLAAQFEDCGQDLRRLFANLDADPKYSEQSSIYLLTERCLSRLISWGHDSGASSRALDHGLRRSMKLRTHTLRLLKDLHEDVVHATLSLFPVTTGFEHEDKADFADPSSSLIQPDIGEAIDIPDDQSLEWNPENYLQDTEEILNDLANLLPALMAPHEDAQPQLSTSDIDQYQRQDSSLIKSLYPAAEPFLTSRLVEANRRRRHHILRLKEAASYGNNATTEKIGLEAKGQGTGLQIPNKPQLNRSSRRIRGYRKTSTLSESEPGGMSDTAPSTRNTSMFTAARHGSKYQQSTTSVGSASFNFPELEPPKPPVDLHARNALPFQCPYCGFEVPLKVEKDRWEERDWTDHFYLDLEPYVCTFEQCSRPHKLFGLKQEWLQHELDYHRFQKVWFCANPSCKLEVKSPFEFEQHLKVAHKDLVAKTKISLLVDNCERLSLESDSVAQKSCPLCRAPYSHPMEWREHIGHHLEQFALTAVGEDDSDDDSDDGVDAGEKKAGIFRVDEFLTDQAGMYANTGNPKEPSVLQSPGDGTDQVREANDFTDSSNFGNAGAKNRKDAQDLWEGKVQDYLKKQPEGSKEPETQGTASPTVWLHIPERNEDFIGRDEDLGMLHESLATMGQICVLSGRGGVGKTATAVEYSHRFKTSYSHVFWLEAETSGRLADQYNSIGTKVFALGGESEQDPLSITLSVKEKLSRWDKTWLIVFDNVEAWRDVARYIPKGLDKTQGSVLITTRQQDLIRSETRLLHRLKLEPMTSEESSQFLLCSIFPKLDKEDVPLHEDYELAIQAADLVERLPLALIMVSGYVTVSKGSLELFLEIWDEKQRFRAKQARRSRLVTEGTLDSSIDLLWDIGISELSVPARNLLEILAFLDPENIPRDLLVGDHTENFLEFLNSTEASLYKRMIRQLRGQKLIDVKTGENGLETYSIHRLLQQKIIIELGMQLKFDSAMKKSTFLVRKKFPRSPVIQAPMPENWPQCKEYMPHVSSLLRAFKEAEELVPRFERTMEIAQLFIDAGFYVWDRQATEYDGLAFLNAAERVLDRHKVDANDKLRADIHCISGLLRNGMGCRQREESLRQLEVARNIRRHIYLEHPYNRDNDVLLQNAATDYGILLLNKYDFTRAENIFTSCLQQYRSWGSEKEIPFEYSKYYYNTGIVRMCQGRLDEAIRFLQRSVDLAKEYRGEEGQYWDNQFTLACVILQSGDVQRALDLHLQTLSAKLDLFGKHSKSTVLSTYAVGAMYAHISDIPTAIDYMENCIELAISSNWTEEALGRAQHYLARLYKKQGGFTREVEELESKAEAVLKKYSAFISGWIRETKEPILMFDDLQPTDEGRFTGRMLLKRLWERQENEELQSGSN